MKIAVIGTGGVGGYFGGKLAKAGYEVRFVARGAHASAMRHYGLMVKSIDGDFDMPNVDVVESIEEIGDRDLILLGVKAWQVKDVARRIKTLVRPDTTVLPLQNGVMAYPELVEELGADIPIKGFCKIISKIDSPGVIDHFGYSPTIIFGENNNGKTQRIKDLTTLFSDSGIRGQVPDDIDVELWKKFIYICSGGLMAVTRTTYGEMRNSKDTMELLLSLFQEIYEVARKTGINVDEELPKRTLDFIYSLPYDASASLTRDILDQKPSEIEYQNGSVVALGKKHDVLTPVNEFITRCIRPMEAKSRRGFERTQ